MPNWSVAATVALLLSSLLLAGCGGNDTSDPPTEVPTEDPTDDPSDAPTDLPTDTSPPPPPNQEPVIVVKLTDESGAETNATLVGHNLTLDVQGTSDPDGTLTFVQYGAVDANGTTVQGTLFLGGTFANATIPVGAAGLGQLAVVAYDDDGGAAVYLTNIYGNVGLRVLSDYNFNLGAPAGATAADCAGPSAAQGAPPNPLDDQMFTLAPFDLPVGLNATFLTAAVSFGSEVPMGDEVAGAELAICLGGEAVSPAGTPSVATGALPAGQASYEVAVLSTRPQTRATVDVVIHFEPLPAAA